MKKLLFVFPILLLMNACQQHPASTAETSKSLNKLFNDYYEERLSYFPFEATAIGDNRFNDQFPVDISDSYRAKLKVFYQKYEDAVSKFDRAQLTDQDALSYDVFKREMNMQIEGLSFKDNLMPINQFWSMNLTFAVYGSGGGNQPFKTVKDYDDFLKRISCFVSYEDTCIANMKRGMAEGITPPKVLMEKVLPQLQNIFSKEDTANVFYGPVKNFPKEFSAADKSRLTTAYSKAIKEEINPTYQKLYNFIKEDYIAKCKDVAGISNIPDGKKYYAYEARLWTTTELTPDQIFAIGEKEVARIKSEMEKIKDEVGFKGDMKSFINFLHTDKQFMPFQKDSDVLAAYRNVETRMQPQLKKLFNLVPKAKFEVRQTEAFRAASSSAEYNQSAPDGSRPGIFYVPILDAKKYNTFGMEDLFLHEAIPGHHYQTSIQQENDSLPKFRRFGWYGAYGEGWALYTESLGKELGLYKDPYQYFASLSEEMHRAIRLVVDVGMHTKGWTREQAINYSVDIDAESLGDITTEIERYMAIPGQALAYKIGQMKIIEIRQRAEKTLGDKFNIQHFHDEVLKDGCLPLDVFEKKMDKWIASQK